MSNFNRNLAVVIGINNYQNGIAELKTAKYDAEEFAKILATDYQYQVELITDDTECQPTLQNIKYLIEEKLPKQIKPTDKDCLIFYFAGHGTPLDSDLGPAGFLLPQDANLREPQTFLSMRALHDALAALSCRHLLVILDCCFAGTFRWSGTRKAIPVPQIIHREHYDRFIRYPAWQVITSAAHNQEALDFLSDKRGTGKDSLHSPFAIALFEALRDTIEFPGKKGVQRKKADLTGDGVITASELYIYLRDCVETRSGERQTPGIWPLSKHDKGEYIFQDPNFDPNTLSKAPKLNENNNPYRGLKPFEEEQARLFFGREELIKSLCDRIHNPDQAIAIVLGASGSGKSSLVKAGLIPYLRQINLVHGWILILTIANAKLRVSLKLLLLNRVEQWQILKPMRPEDTPFVSLARIIFAIANVPATVELDSLNFFNSVLSPKIKQLNSDFLNSKIRNGLTSDETQSVQKELENFNYIADIWKTDNTALKQSVAVEYFEELNGLCQNDIERELLKNSVWNCLTPLSDRLESDPHQFIQIIESWSRQNPGVKLLLVIDQFEELITLNQNHQIKVQQFFKLAEEILAANLSQLCIVVTLRSDFEPRFLESPTVRSYWTKARFPVRAMKSDELRRAIEAPATEMALYFDPPNLVDRLIDEVGQMPGALPLLSFTLSEFYIKLYEKWQQKESSDRALTIDAEFDKEGGIAGSLTRRANLEYNALPDDAHRATMRRVLLRMLAIEGGNSTRRKVPLSEFVYREDAENQRVEKVLECLDKARLIIRGEETGEAYAEPAHDFLVRGWQQLEEWKSQAQQNILVQRELTIDVKNWVEKKAGGLLWDNDPRLLQIRAIFTADKHWFNAHESKFIERSIQRRQLFISLVIGIILSLFGLTIFSLIQLQFSVLREKAARVRNLLVAGKPIDGLLLAVQSAGENRRFHQLMPLVPEAIPPVQSSLLSAIEIPKESNILKAHQRPVTSVTISPNSQIIVSGSSDKTLRLWDFNGKPIGKPFQGQGNWVTAVAFSPNGKLIVSGSNDGTLRLWDLNGNPIAKPFKQQNINLPSSSSNSSYSYYAYGAPTSNLGKNYQVTAVAFNPKNGQIIASGSNDGILRLWDLKGNLKQQFQAHQANITAVAFSPDGKFIVTGSNDKTLRLWDLNGKPIGKPFQGHRGGVTSVAFSPNNKYSGFQMGEVQPNGFVCVAAPLRVPLHKQSRTSYGCKPLYIVSGSEDQTLRLWNLNGNPIGESFRGNVSGVTTVAFSPNSQTIVSGSKDNSIRLWDLNGNQIGQPLQGHTSWLRTVAFSPDGRFIVSGSNDNTVRLWDLQENKRISQTFREATGKDYPGQVWRAAISADGQTIVSGSYDSNGSDGGSVRLWNRQGKPIGKPFQGKGVTVLSIAMSADGKTIVSGSDDGRVRLSNRQGNLIAASSSRHQQRVSAVTISTDGKTIVSGGGDGIVSLWKVEGNQLVELHHLQAYDKDKKSVPVNSVAISPDGATIASGSNDGTIRLWDVQGKLLRSAFQGHPLGIESLAFSRDGKYIASGSEDNTLRLWDFKGNLIGEPFQGHTGWVSAIAFSPNSQFIASGSWDNTVRLWDLQGNPLGDAFEGHKAQVTSVVFSTDGKSIISGSADKTIRTWRAGTWQDWLQIGCNQLRHHPALLNPENETARGAKNTCQL
ncbi:nSTAND1 domain-containing NTPase [Microseira wollei]|nr:caspase family protein [Microseira wollei]